MALKMKSRGELYTADSASLVVGNTLFCCFVWTQYDCVVVVIIINTFFTVPISVSWRSTDLTFTKIATELFFFFQPHIVANSISGSVTTSYAPPELRDLQTVVGIEGWIYHRHATDGACHKNICLTR